ncbi:MAG: Fe-S cluster assembly ATPase SufC [Oceanococcaceae bacterium]
MSTLLDIRDLSVQVGETPILKSLNLQIGAGEVHAVMGPNGSGKSTLAQVLSGREDYTVTAGAVTLDGQDLLALEPEERAIAGLFLGFQYPVEVPGVSNMNLLKAAVAARAKARGEEELTAVELMGRVRKAADALKIPVEMLKRGVNEGFSGGEKKRNEILQMLVLEPRLAILDETDSGLDIDAIRVVAEGVNSLRAPERSVLLITHFQRLLDHITPDRIHILVDGQIQASGGPELARELEAEGYARFQPQGHS